MKTHTGLFLAAATLCLVAAGCTVEDEVVAGPTVVVERWDQEGECFALCPLKDAYPDGLTLTQQCESPAKDCDLLGGEDSLRVTVDLGEVDVPRTKELAAPRVDQILDGKVTTLANACPPRVPGTTRTVYSCVVDAPVQEAKAFSLRADFGSGFGGESATFRVQGPVVELLPASCDPSDCAVEAGVGQLAFTVSAARVLENKALVFGVLDGQPQGTVGEVTLSGVAGTRRTGPLTLKVPAPEDVDWHLTVQVGGVSSDSFVVHVGKLSLFADLPECATQPEGECKLAGGKTTALLLTAPQKVLDGTATVWTRIDGLTEPGGSEVTLESIDGETRIGSAKIPVPDAPGKTFQVIARVGDSARSTEVVTIVAPTMP